MHALFPSSEWVSNLLEKLNTDEQYASIAHDWEGDLLFLIEPGNGLEEEMKIYLDLWHGTCRAGYIVPAGADKEAAFTMQAVYGNFVRILTGELDAMQALMTRRLKLKGSMAYMMRNIPTVLDFVRCAREITHGFIDQKTRK